MKKRWITTERVVAITASLFLSLSVIASFFFLGEDPNCIIPRSDLVAPVIHGLCLILSIICIFKPTFKLEFSIMQIEAFLTINVGYQYMGVFLFYGSMFLFLCQQVPYRKTIYAIVNFLLIHLISIVMSYRHGLAITFLTLVCSVFYGAFFFWIYTILKQKFECFTPAHIEKHSLINGVRPGEPLVLSDYNLTERQKHFVIDNIKEKLAYKDISEKYNVSISTVKKEFTQIFDVFGVTKSEELHILLLQYKLVE